MLIWVYHQNFIYIMGNYQIISLKQRLYKVGDHIDTVFVSAGPVQLLPGDPYYINGFMTFGKILIVPVQYKKEIIMTKLCTIVFHPLRDKEPVISDHGYNSNLFVIVSGHP